MLVSPIYAVPVENFARSFFWRNSDSPWHALKHSSDPDNEKEEEMQIGLPTDVKHVAHIGMDGPSANTPSWMNEYKGTPETSSVSSSNGPKKKSATKSSSKDPSTRELPGVQKPPSGPMDSPTQDLSVESPRGKTKQSRRHHHHSSSGAVDSPTRDPSGTPKPRRHKNSGELDSPTRQAKPHNNSNLGSESPSQDSPGLPKQSRRKKSKGSSGGGPTRSSRSKGSDPMTENFPYSDTGTGSGLMDNEAGPKSVLKGYEEGNECEEISRGIRAL